MPEDQIEIISHKVTAAGIQICYSLSGNEYHPLLDAEESAKILEKIGSINCYNVIDDIIIVDFKWAGVQLSCTWEKYVAGLFFYKENALAVAEYLERQKKEVGTLKY